jgi:hypothetical protein
MKTMARRETFTQYLLLCWRTDWSCN